MGDTTIDARSLGPEMIAEGWLVIGGDWILWLHPTSQRSVCVDGPIAWKQTRRIPAWRGEPRPNDEGYLVKCAYHDELGNPTSGDVVFVLEYGLAVKLARRIRADILAERPVNMAVQLTLDDAIDGVRS